LERQNEIEDVLRGDESLKTFTQQLKKFDQKFCEGIVSGADFTIKIEVRGNNGELVHARVYTDEIARPRPKHKENRK